MGLFHELSKNPFEEAFKKASEESKHLELSEVSYLVVSKLIAFKFLYYSITVSHHFSQSKHRLMHAVITPHIIHTWQLFHVFFVSLHNAHIFFAL